MNILDYNDLMMWGVIIALVVLATMTGMWLNRFFTHRAIAELRRRALMTESHLGMEPERATVSDK